MAALDSSTTAPARFLRLAWIVLAATVAVIISGDIVQATESGAGCGEHWPRCDGSLIPSIGDSATAIEFAHRAATFVLSALVAWLYFFARRTFDVGHRIRGAMRWLVTFFLLEVGVGALLVAFGWVEDDASIGRIVADGLHVVNTFFLVAAIVLVVHYAAGGRRGRFGADGSQRRMLLFALSTVVLIAVTGAINSLADTLFPAETVLEGIRDEFGRAAPFLLRIRAVHPVVAIVGGVAVFSIVRSLGDAATNADTHRLARVVQYTVGVQFALGILNLALLTPLETQVLHLLTADVLWIALLLFAWQLGEPAASDPVDAPDLQGADL